MSKRGMRGFKRKRGKTIRMRLKVERLISLRLRLTIMCLKSHCHAINRIRNAASIFLSTTGPTLSRPTNPNLQRLQAWPAKISQMMRTARSCPRTLPKKTIS